MKGRERGGDSDLEERRGGVKTCEGEGEGENNGSCRENGVESESYVFIRW